MHAVKIKAGEWVVVCDGRKALILVNAGDDVFPNLQTKETREDDNPKTSDQGSDRPGRVHESAASWRSSVSQTDWHEQAEREFLVSLARRLDEAVSRRETETLIMVASPRALGMIREAYSPALRKAVREEIGKDYTHLPVYEIEKHLTPQKA